MTVYTAGAVWLLSVFKPMVNMKVSPVQLPDGPPSYAAATRLLSADANFPFTAYLQAWKSGMFFGLSAVVLTDVDCWEGLSGATYPWPLRFSVL